MDKSLIVFREKHHYFGIFPHEFERHLLLDQIWISPSDKVPALWQFEGRPFSLKGYLIHLGSLLGLPQISFSHQGYVFLKKYEDQSHWGVFLNDIYLQTTLKKIGKKSRSPAEVTPLAEDIPENIFHSVIRYRRKDIWVIDPVGLFQFLREKMQPEVQTIPHLDEVKAQKDDFL